MEVKIVRLVDLDAVIDCLEMEWGYEGIREDLYSLPTVDSVPVVRCKDCKHGFFHNSSGGMYCCTNPAGLSLQTPNAFCCYGEKKEGEENG